MTMQDRIMVAVGAVVAVLLQIAIAPHIMLFGAIPDFIAVYALVVAILRARVAGSVLPFLLGLFYDLFTGGPVGAMAFSLTLVSFAVSFFFANMDNDTAFMPIVTLAAGAFLVELVYASFLLLFGYPAGLLEAFAYRILPCTAYDIVVGVLMFLLLRRLFAPSVQVRSDITQLR